MTEIYMFVKNKMHRCFNLVAFHYNVFLYNDNNFILFKEGNTKQ